MSRLLVHGSFHYFRSVVARYDPASRQPPTLVWDIEPRLIDRAILELNDRLYFNASGSPIDRPTAYALSVFTQKESVQDYVVHKASLSLNGRDVEISNAGRLAKEFSDEPQGTLFEKCFNWLHQKKFRPEEVLEGGTAWRLALAIQHVLFPYYIGYLLRSSRMAGFVQHWQLFMHCYEKASFVPMVAKQMRIDNIGVREKFYLVNMANPDKQVSKFRFRAVCEAIELLKDWRRSFQDMIEVDNESS